MIGSPPAGAARRMARPQPRQQLAHPERLGDVVVGAGVEGGDLLPLLADRREDHDRHASSTCAARGTRPRRSRRAAPGRARRHPAAGWPRPPAPPRPSPHARPRSRRRAGWWSARAGSAARRRPPGSGRPRSLRRLVRRREGQREARRPGRGATPPTGGRRLPRRTRGRSQGRGRCRSDPAPALRGRTARRRARARSPAARAPGRSRARSPPCGCAFTRTVTGLSGGRELERVVDQVAQDLAHLDGVDQHGRQCRPGRRRSPGRCSFRPRPASRRRGRRPSTPPAWARARPACSRDRASRLSTTRSSRRTSTLIVSSSSRRSSSVSTSVSSSSPSLAARMAVSGERRSWLTARSTAVFMVSERRSASASKRLVGQPLAVDRDGQQRRQRRQQPAARRQVGLAALDAARASPPGGCRPRARSGRRSWSARASAPITIDADRALRIGGHALADRIELAGHVCRPRAATWPRRPEAPSRPRAARPRSPAGARSPPGR